MVLIAKLSEKFICHHMGNSIQYHNTDNPSQIHGGLMKTASVHPPLGVPRGGVNENLTPAIMWK